MKIQLKFIVLRKFSEIHRNFTPKYGSYVQYFIYCFSNRNNFMFWVTENVVTVSLLYCKFYKNSVTLW